MFCSSCGSQLAKAAKFCQVCGITIGVKEEDLSCVAQLEVEPSERKRHQTALLTFEEYRERKGKERTSRFVSKSSKKAKKESGENEVSIHTGFIRLKDGELKVIRGSSLPLKVLPSIGAEVSGIFRIASNTRDFPDNIHVKRPTDLNQFTI